MLQNMKDFDFQIKKNQDEITKIGEKIDGITKDLDDLVSLYEIVSEQMNPFVGLSKVTKKRIDALENFTQEIEIIKNRMEDVESVMGQKLGYVSNTYTKNTEEKQASEASDIDNDTKIEAESEISSPDTKEGTENIAQDTQEGIDQKPESMQTIAQPATIQHDSNAIDSSSEIDQSMYQESVGGYTSNETMMSDTDLDAILAKSLESFIAEQNIEQVINDFLLSLK